MVSFHGAQNPWCRPCVHQHISKCAIGAEKRVCKLKYIYNRHTVWAAASSSGERIRNDRTTNRAVKTHTGHTDFFNLHLIYCASYCHPMLCFYLRKASLYVYALGAGRSGAICPGPIFSPSHIPVHGYLSLLAGDLRRLRLAEI